MLKDKGLWLRGLPHGMDALLHVMAYARRIGLGLPPKPERIWQSMEHLRKGRVSSKVC